MKNRKMMQYKIYKRYTHIYNKHNKKQTCTHNHKHKVMIKVDICQAKL